ncbi:hypothetical protein EAG_15144 [Camponotus floridanus]|uniref:Uncharacterized protein n=1 Tax=Camponotus floridanus TaxID=104421 RepID=E1ZYP5_CAMFO|nr:hypothetical protein EAG_15144 [Camponotus floridanus]
MFAEACGTDSAISCIKGQAKPWSIVSSSEPAQARSTEKAACHATMGPHSGDAACQGARGTKTTVGRGGGEGGHVYVGRQREEEGSETKGEMQQQQQQQLSLPVPPFVLP